MDYFSFVLPLLLQLALILSITCASQPLCHNHERVALLQFKDSFVIDKSASSRSSAYPKVASWTSQENDTNHDCCSWDGVECDEETGYVIALELNSSCLYGSINSTASLFQLSQLQRLDLSDNHFDYSRIPSALANLSRLTYLDLSQAKLYGQIPPELSNLTQLVYLNLEESNLHGTLPSSFSRLKNLEVLGLFGNKLSGSVDFDIFLGMKNLSVLQLSDNKLTVLTSETNNTKNGTHHGFPSFVDLELDSCNLLIFPDFLRYQNNLEFLKLARNQIHGKIPKWVLNMSLETMKVMDLSHNFLTGFDQRPPAVLPWARLKILHLFNNMLRGSLPAPPPSIINFDIFNNKLSGEISPLFCNLGSIQYMDLSINKLRGMLPQCLKNLSGDSLLFLNVADNVFHGSIPEICTNGSQLRMVDLSHNKFQGRLPRSMRSCKMLQVLNLGNNQLTDVFPSWLGTLQDLRILKLQFNHLHGIIRKPKISNYGFPNMRFIDLSHNNFTGRLPFEYFQNWNSMKATASSSSYFKATSSFIVETALWTITVKGLDRVFQKTEGAFVVIDFSSNRFEGEIPEWIGSLRGIQVLNFANNILTGTIPSTLGNISRLESLDLSRNKLFGEIPRQLTQLTLLSFFNMSHNHLKGLVPQGNQFNKFDSSSYVGNLGLCGYPLPTECGNSESNPSRLPPSTFEEDNDWIAILAGYVSGLVVGIIVAHLSVTFTI